VSVEVWWEDLRVAALVGTARREVPAAPDLGWAVPAGSREERLLVGAALGDAVRRAGRPPSRAPAGMPVQPAAEETLEVAPAAATQVLDLLLTQAPVSAEERASLVRHWADSAARAQRRVAPALLPPLLDLAGAQHTLREAVRPVLGEVGRWLCEQRPEWSWAAASAVSEADGDADPASAWLHLDTPRRVTLLDSLRRTDPTLARELVDSTWDTDTAKDRTRYVETFRAGLADADADFLDRCLDDRSKGVREVALRLLDRLPRSARAERMRERLRPLLSVQGRARKTLAVELPDDPDQSARRDGLSPAQHPGSARARWLQQIVAGAPLETWVDVTGLEPTRIVRLLDDTEHDAVLRGLRTAAAGRRDVVWARALLERTWDISLAVVLPPEELQSALVHRLAKLPLVSVQRDLLSVPRPYRPELSRALVASWRRSKDPAAPARMFHSALTGALDASVMPELERWLTSLGPDGDRFLRTTLRDLLQEHSLRTSISEAFR
jgi:Family of unknown function (DUF5691)